MRFAIGPISVVAFFSLNQAVVGSSDCALKVADYVRRVEALIDQERLSSPRSLEPYSTLKKAFPVFENCNLQEIKQEISRSKYGADGISWQERPDVWNFELSDGKVGVGFAYFPKQQISKFHYVRWKTK